MVRASFKKSGHFEARPTRAPEGAGTHCSGRMVRSENPEPEVRLQPAGFVALWLLDWEALGSTAIQGFLTIFKSAAHHRQSHSLLHLRRYDSSEFFVRLNQ